MRIVIVGGGFAGVKAALELAKLQIGTVTLISKTPYFLHSSVLCATATGKNTEDSTIPLDVVFSRYQNVELIKDEIKNIDHKKQLVSSNHQNYYYDKLILAPGMVASYNNIRGLARNAFGLRTLKDVEEFQSRITDSITEKKLDSEYFIIGAGLTGVELAGSLATYLKKLKALYKIKGAGPKVTIVEAKSRITPKVSKTASKKISKRLQKIGVNIITNQKVTELDDNSITVGDKKYPTETAFWTSGGTTSPIFKQHSDIFDIDSETDLVKVNNQLEASENIYVIGDSALVKRGGNHGSAARQGIFVANDIARIATSRKRSSFKPKRYITSVPIGQDWGYVEWLGVYQSGRLGYRIRRMIELNSYSHLVPLSVAIPIWRVHSQVEVDDIK